MSEWKKTAAVQSYIQRYEYSDTTNSRRFLHHIFLYPEDDDRFDIFS